MSIRKKLGIAYLVMIAIVLYWTAPIWTRMWGQREAAIRTFDAYAAALDRGDYVAAREHFAIEADAHLSLQQYVQWNRELEKDWGPLKTIHRDDISVEGRRDSPIVWTAEIDATHRYQKRSVVFEYDLHMENGCWVIWRVEQLN